MVSWIFYLPTMHFIKFAKVFYRDVIIISIYLAKETLEILRGMDQSILMS